MSGVPSDVWTDEGQQHFCKTLGKILCCMDSFSQKTHTSHQSFILASCWVRSVYNSSQLKTQIFPKAWFSDFFRLPSHLLCNILCHHRLFSSCPMHIYRNSSSLPQTSAFLGLQLLSLFILHNVYSFTQEETAFFHHREIALSVQILQLFATSLAQRKYHVLQGTAEQKDLWMWKAWKAEESLGRISWGFTPWEEEWAIPSVFEKGLIPIYMGFCCFQGQEVASRNS